MRRHPLDPDVRRVLESQQWAVIVSPTQCQRVDLGESQRIARLASDDWRPMESNRKDDAAISEQRLISGRDHRFAGLELSPQIRFAFLASPSVGLQVCPVTAPCLARRLVSQSRVMEASQASAPVGMKVTAIALASIESTRQPSPKLALISPWVTRRGPNVPGC
jgi:hypothetical protein